MSDPIGEVLLIDGRELEPPQPMLKVLQAIKSLPQGSRITLITHRQPMFLLAELEERHITYRSCTRPDSTWATDITL